MTNIKCPKYICIVARTCIAMLYLYCCSFYSKNILRRIMHNNSTQYTLPFFFIINTVPRCWSRAQMWFGFVVCVFETILFPCASHCLSRTQLILVLLVFFFKRQCNIWRRQHSGVSGLREEEGETWLTGTRAHTTIYRYLLWRFGWGFFFRLFLRSKLAESKGILSHGMMQMWTAYQAMGHTDFRFHFRPS